MNYKKVLLVIPYFLLWILYVLLTMKRRLHYMAGEEKGMKCFGSRDSGFIPYTQTTYYFDPTKKPERDYLTWKEFWKARGY